MLFWNGTRETLNYWTQVRKKNKTLDKPQLLSQKLNLDMEPDPTEAKFLDPDPQLPIAWNPVWMSNDKSLLIEVTHDDLHQY
jgi:hypothetical protein